jgi:hypothetical protein
VQKGGEEHPMKESGAPLFIFRKKVGYFWRFAWFFVILHLEKDYL